MPTYLFEVQKVCGICGKNRYDNRDDDLCSKCAWSKKKRDKRFDKLPDECKCEECGKKMKSNKYSIGKCLKCLGGKTEYYRIVRDIKAKQEAIEEKANKVK